MQCAFDFSGCSGQAATCVGVVGAVDLFDVSVSIFLDTCALHYVRAFETYLSIGGESEEFLGGILHEVVTLNVYLTREWHLMHT